MNLALLQSNLTPITAIVGKQPLAIFKKTNERNLVKAISNLIWAIQRSLNLSQKMDEIQSMEAAIAIIDEFGDLTLEEITLCFKEAKLGKYGKDRMQVYNRIDIQIISEWLLKYRTSEERLNYFENRHKNINDKQDLFAEVTDEEALKQIKAIRENLTRSKPMKVISIKDALKEEKPLTEEEAIDKFILVKERLNENDLLDYKDFFIKAKFKKGLSICYTELIRRENEV